MIDYFILMARQHVKSYSIYCDWIFDIFWGNPRCKVANVLVCVIVVNEFELQSKYYVHFRTNTKAWTLLYFQLWVKEYHCCFSSRIGFGIE